MICTALLKNLLMVENRGNSKERGLMKKLLTLIFILSSFLIVGCENNENGYEIYSETIEMMIETAERRMQSNSIPGMTIAFVDINSDFTWTHSFGYADIEQGILVTEDTLFGISGISNTFTAIAVMQLVEQGLLDLDEPIVTYLPEFSMLPHPEYGGNYQNITTRMLLNNTSGIPRDYWGIEALYRRGLSYVITVIASSEDDIIGAASLNSHQPEFMNNFLINISELTMDFEEGTAAAYSNIGYTILGILIASISNDDDYFEGFASYMTDHVLTPAEMNHSTFVMTEEFFPSKATAYRNATTEPDETLLLNIPMSMFSTGSDMARFMHIILEGGGVLLNNESLMQMVDMTDVEFDERVGGVTRSFGLGFFQPVPSNVAMVGHSGGWQHYSAMFLNLEYGIGVFIAVNSESGATAPTPFASTALESAVEERQGSE